MTVSGALTVPPEPTSCSGAGRARVRRRGPETAVRRRAATEPRDQPSQAIPTRTGIAAKRNSTRLRKVPAPSARQDRGRRARLREHRRQAAATRAAPGGVSKVPASRKAPRPFDPEVEVERNLLPLGNQPQDDERFLRSVFRTAPRRSEGSTAARQAEAWEVGRLGPRSRPSHIASSKPPRTLASQGDRPSQARRRDTVPLSGSYPDAPRVGSSSSRRPGRNTSGGIRSSGDPDDHDADDKKRAPVRRSLQARRSSVANRARRAASAR